jgi:hypothetical protein
MLIRLRADFVRPAIEHASVDRLLHALPAPAVTHQIMWIRSGRDAFEGKATGRAINFPSDL